MRHEIREKHSREKTRDAVVPGHCDFECNPTLTNALFCRECDAYHTYWPILLTRGVRGDTLKVL